MGQSSRRAARRRNRPPPLGGGSMAGSAPPRETGTAAHMGFLNFLLVYHIFPAPATRFPPSHLLCRGKNVPIFVHISRLTVEKSEGFSLSFLTNEEKRIQWMAVSAKGGQKRTGYDRGAAAKSTHRPPGRHRGWGKGLPPKDRLPVWAAGPGPPENIRRTVTKVVRCHDKGCCVYSVMTLSWPDFFGILRRKEK